MIGAASEPSRAYRASGEIELLLRSMRKSPRNVECCAVVGPKSQGDTAISPAKIISSSNFKIKRNSKPAELATLFARQPGEHHKIVSAGGQAKYFWNLLKR